jgi:hypothetical protein
MQKRVAQEYGDDGFDRLQSVVDGIYAEASLPNPHSPTSGASAFPNLPNPHPFPGEHQAFTDGNPIAVPASGGLEISSSDIEQAQRADMPRQAGVAARARRVANRTIPSGGSGFAAHNHPAFSPTARKQLGDEIRNDQKWARSQTLGSTLRDLKEQKTEDPKEKEDKFGMTDEEYERRFSQD